MAKKLFILGNGVDWCEKALIGINTHKNIYLVNKKIPVNGNLKTKIAKIFFSYKINKRIKIPFKFIWYKDIKKYIDKFIGNDELVLLIYDHNIFGGEYSFLQYLRKKYSNVKIAYIFTNIVEFTAAKEKNYLNKLNEWYDIVFAFDQEDAKKYNFEYSPLIYDIDINENNSSNIKENQVFYIGQAKDRLGMLIKCYEKLKSLNIKCDFHIANVNENDKKYDNEIEYNHYMTYEEAIKSIKESTCLIDIIQGDSTGLTIKTCEAVCYNKKLITTNTHVVEYPFYDPRYIKVIRTPDDIDLDFFYNNKDIQYSKEGKEYFSFESFLAKLNHDLNLNI